MNTHFAPVQENKSKAAANSFSQNAGTSPAAFQFAPRHGSSAPQRSGPNTGIAQHKAQSNEAPAQLSAYANNLQIIEYANPLHGFETFTNAALNPQQATIIDDPFNRYYNSRQEFINHTTGQPVDCGLIPHLAKWYRLPFSGGFFVLGENHGVVNYRQLIEESNQAGNVLGEGGTVPIDQYTPAHGARGALPARALQGAGGAQEFPMESVLSKTLYALVAADAGYKKELNEGPPQPPAARDTQLPDVWIPGAAGKQVTRDARQVPSYMDGTRKYLAPVVPVAAANYSVIGTAITIITSCRTALLAKQALNPAGFDADLKDLLTTISEITALLPNGAATVLSQKQKNRLAYNLLPTAVSRCSTSAKLELRRSTIVRGGDNAETLHQEFKGHHGALDVLGDACSMRDVYMFEAIRRAHAAGFTMAGIGNNHALHLRPALQVAGIDVISYTEFMSAAHTRDAF